MPHHLINFFSKFQILVREKDKNKYKGGMNVSKEKPLDVVEGEAESKDH